jgi:hypothetical protein
MSTLTEGQQQRYVTRPAYKDKFPVHAAREIIRSALEAKLAGVDYDLDQTTRWTKEIADDVRDRLKALKLARYKIMVQVIIGEQRGEGVRVGCRCFWDNDTDSQASVTFSNDSLFCVCTAFGVYLY